MKEIKKTIGLIKQFLVFSSTERKGIFILLTLIGIIVFTPMVYRTFFPPKVLDVKITDLLTKEVEENNSADSTTQLPASSHSLDKLAIAPFYFDPNTIDSAGLLALGFKPKVARSIVNYRFRGGYFKEPNELYRIYGIDSALVERLQPFVQINQTSLNRNKEKNFTPKNLTVKKQVWVDLNTADSAQLVALYGIGPKMATKIIDYRQRIGGFVNTQQLLEIYGMDEDVLIELEGKIYADLQQIRYLNINTVSLEELKRNPYVKSKLANAIVNYRAQHGYFKHVEGLKRIIIMHDSTYNKLLPYLRVN